MIALKAIVCLLVFTISTFLYAGEVTDEHESCPHWAEIGECEKNPNYMLQSCKKSCASAKTAPPPSSRYKSFYDIVEKDINGNTVNFSDFEGSIVYLVNVASQCGYTASNYAMFKKLTKYLSAGLKIVLAPWSVLLIFLQLFLLV